MSDTETATERFTLTWHQIIALYIGLNEHNRLDIDLPRGSAVAVPRTVPLPPYPACGAWTRELSWRTDRISLGQEYGFRPCGHVVYIAEADLQRLWDQTRYRPGPYSSARGICSCQASHCSGCHLGYDLDHPSALALESGR